MVKLKIRFLWLCLLLVPHLLLPATVRAESGGSASVAKRMLGGWERTDQGYRVLLNLDGQMTNPTDGLTGNAYYNVRGDVVIFGFNGRIAACKVTFPKQDTMVWKGIVTGEIAEFHRTPVPRVAKNTEALLAALAGKWHTVDAGKRVEIRIDELKVAGSFASEPIDSVYLVRSSEISFNSVHGVQTYQVAFDADESMIWTDSSTKKALMFVRQ